MSVLTTEQKNNEQRECSYNLLLSVRESDDVVGYYDIVSETFYEPIGTNPTVEE